MSDQLKFFCDEMRHLICVPYTVENLHKTAKILNIKRCWFHYGASYPHYDIPKRRIAEIQAKCMVIPGRTMLKIMKGELPDGPPLEVCDREPPMPDLLEGLKK